MSDTFNELYEDWVGNKHTSLQNTVAILSQPFGADIHE